MSGARHLLCATAVLLLVLAVRNVPAGPEASTRYALAGTDTSAPRPTVSLAITKTRAPTRTPTPIPTGTLSSTSTPTPVASSTPVQTESPTPTGAATPTLSTAAGPTNTPTPVATETPPLTSTPAPTAAQTPTPTGTPTASPKLSLTLSVNNTSFGTISPAGDIDPTVSAVSSVPDTSGAYYIKRGSGIDGALQVTVFSNRPWTGSCWAVENTGSAATIVIRDARLDWSLAGQGVWTPFTTMVGRPPYNNACFETRHTGNNTYRYDFRLRVNWTDSPGTFSSIVIYAVSQ